jgi:hypothetical protein
LVFGYWVHFFKSALQLSTILDYRFSEVKIPSCKKHNCFWHSNNWKIFQIADDETDEEEAQPPILYEDKDTDDEESDDDAMETDGEGEELGDSTDALEHSDGSGIMSDWLVHSSRTPNRHCMMLLENYPWEARARNLMVAMYVLG